MEFGRMLNISNKIYTYKSCVYKIIFLFNNIFVVFILIVIIFRENCIFLLSLNIKFLLMTKKFTFFFYKCFKYSHKIIYAKFHCDSLITYKDILLKIE